MKEITAKNSKTTAVYRVDKRSFYLKGENANPQVSPVMAKMKEMGVHVEANKGWIKGDFSEVDIKGLENANDEQIEAALVEFIKGMLIKAKFTIEVKEI